jgi:hypothetical protein
MKKLLPVLFLTFLSLGSFAQNWLDSVIVEKYYVSDGNDTSVNSTGGVLPVGSVTYRIYVDMQPNYRFQAAFGVPGIQGHDLKIQTSTLFFNNEDRGATSPTYTKTQAKKNTVMLDSWLSVGAGCAGNFGVLKQDDDGVLTVSNSDGVLQNADPLAGIPISTQDGLLNLAPTAIPQNVTFVGTTNQSVFDNQNDGTNGPLFFTDNGSWASLNGSVGPDSATTNRVLIAQITTDGILSFELNLQIGTPAGVVPATTQQYVAKNPIGNEILCATCSYTSAVGISQPTKSSKPTVLVYPNPVKDVLNLELNSTSRYTNSFYTVYDILGKSLVTKRLNVSTDKTIEKVDFSSFSNGIYFVEFNLDGTTTTKKVVKN